MPTYGYRCPSCGNEYEGFQKISETSPLPCPKCGTAGERLISGGAGILFKGSGFYETDYKRAGGKPKSETTSESGSSGGSDAGGSKPKAEPKPGTPSKGDDS